MSDVYDADLETDDEDLELPDPDADLEDADDGHADAGAVDPSEAGDGSGDDGSAQPPQVEGQPSTRGANRHQVLANRAAEAEARAAAAEARIQAIEAENARRTREQSAAEEARRLEMMSPDEQFAYRIQKLEASNKRTLEEIRFQSFDASDKAAFDAKAASNPAVAAVAAEVEVALKAMRDAGTNAPRATVAAYLIGQKALDRAPRARAAAARTADANRARQTVRAPSSRSDVGGGRGAKSERTARYERLKDVEL